MPDIEESQQIIDEWYGKRKDRVDRRQAWETVLKAKQYAALSTNPGNLPGIFSQDPTKAPGSDLDGFGGGIKMAANDPLGGMGEYLGERTAALRSEFVTEYERAYYQHREKIPFDWWLQWSPGDLRLIGGGDPQMAEIAQAVAERQWYIARETEYQANLEAEVDRRMESLTRGRDFAGYASKVLLGTVGYGGRRGTITPVPIDREEVKRMVEAEAGGFKDTLFEEDIKAWYERERETMLRFAGGIPDLDETAENDEEQRRRQEQRVDAELAIREQQIREAINRGEDPSKVLGTQGLMTMFIDGGLQGLGWAMKKAVGGLSGAVWAVDFALTPGEFGPYDYLQQKSEEKKESLIAQAQQELAAVDKDAAKLVAMGGARQAWDKLASENPELRDEYLRMGGLDPTVAFALFTADVFETPEAEEQLSQLVEDMREAENAYLRHLEEKDFRVSDTMMDAIAWYGGHVPNYLASFVTVTMTDADIWSKGFQDGFLNLMGEIDETINANNNTPSEVIGIQGSMAGLMLDLTGGIAFDPITWFTGARASLKNGVKVSTLAEADTLARSPLIKKFMEDAYRVATSPSYSPTALQHLIGWMDDLSRQRFLAGVDVAPQTLKYSPWRKSAGRTGAMEVKTSFLESLGPDLSKVKDGAVTAVQKDIVKNGFKEALEVTIGRDGTIAMTDGVKRLIAAQREGITHVPVRLRIVDDIGNVAKKSIDDILDEGMELYRPLAEVPAEEVFARIDSVIPRSVLNDVLPEAELIDIARNAILKRGALPDGVHKSFVARMWNNQIRTAIRTTRPGRWISRYMTQQNIVTRFELVGPGAMEKLYDAIGRVWGDDVAKADQYTWQIMEFEQRAARNNFKAVQALKGIQELRHEISALEDMTGGVLYRNKQPMSGTWDEGIAAWGREVRDKAVAGEDVAQESLEISQAWKNHKQTQAQLVDKKKQFDRMYQKYHELSRQLPDTSELAKIVEEMWNDYNRTHLATMKQWKPYVDVETGMVPWDKMQRGVGKKRQVAEPAAEGQRTILPETVRDLAKELDLDAEKLAKYLSNTFDNTMAVSVPMSPLDMMIASEVGGARYTRLTHSKKVAFVRESALAVHMLWTVDKVFRLATGVTVSFDELLRMVHIRGPQGALEWMYDRGQFMKARSMAAVKEGINPLRREARHAGQKYLSPRAQERIRAVGDFPTALKQAERQFYDGNGLGWYDIMPDEVGYREAAQQWGALWLQDSGFRAFLSGRKAFDDWYFSPDGARMRNAAALAKDKTGNITTRVLSDVEEAYAGWDTMWRLILHESRKNGKHHEVAQAIKDTARKIDEAGGRPHNLPDFVIDNLGPVRGVKKNFSRKGNIEHLTETFFDNFFMDPVNYRRGFVAEMTRQVERGRIESLLAQQNIRIVSDLEFERMLGLDGLGQLNRVGFKNAFNAMAEKMGVVTESMIADMVERAVWKEIDNVLFTWDRGSRFGQQLKTVFPFGRPWADMAGFWGREMLRRPVLKGWVNESNFMGLKSLNERGLLPNPKPAAMMSRLAATDFTVDKGWFGGGEGLLPGSTETDFSPLFFLPTEGENPFGSLLPGLGFVPMWALDMVLDRMVDPVNEPEKYMEILENISDFIPGFRYQQGGFISRMLGGGSLGTAASVITDGLGIANSFMGPGVSESFYSFTSTLGDITREVTRTREISALLADDEELQSLLTTADPNEVEMYLHGLAIEADRRASGHHLLGTLARWVVPASQRYDTSLSDIFDVWVDAADKFSQLQVRPDLRDADMTDPELRRQFANDVRKSFFELPQWERDLLVAQQPNLAVNLVGSWEWTPAGITENLPGSDKSYRTGGGVDDIARHQYYVEQGYVRPVQPIERARRILGLMFAAKEGAAKEAYTMVATNINDHLWDYVTKSEEHMGLLNLMLSQDWAKDLGLKTPRELWERWGSLEGEFEDWIADERGIKRTGDLTEEEEAAWDAVRSIVKLPGVLQPWGTSWPGLNPEALAQRFQSFPAGAFLTDEAKKIVQGLGLDVDNADNGLQFYNELLSVVTQVDNPVYSTVKASYQAYTNARSAASLAAQGELDKAANNPELQREWREDLSNFMSRAELVAERWRDAVGGIPLAQQLEMVDDFDKLRFASDLPLNWEKIWADRYESTYGPLTWNPPTPAAPYREDGTINPHAMAPYIVNVVDGDSLVIRDGPDGDMMVVRLLGVRARDFGLDNEGASDDKDRLYDALQSAMDNDDTIWVVRDPDTFGSSTDHYGRMLAWLWIGDMPFYFEEDFRRQQTPSGGE